MSNFWIQYILYICPSIICNFLFCPLMDLHSHKSSLAFFLIFLSILSLNSDKLQIQMLSFVKRFYPIIVLLRRPTLLTSVHEKSVVYYYPLDIQLPNSNIFNYLIGFIFHFALEIFRQPS